MTLSLTDETGNALDVAADGRPLFTYVYRPSAPRRESPKPYLHPVRTLGGEVITLLRPHDHPWHCGISMTCTSINDANFWGGYTWVTGQGYVEVPNYGQQQHRAWLAQDNDGQRIALRQQLAWTALDGAQLIDESREIGVALCASDPEAWTLRFVFSLTNISGVPLEFSSPTVKGRPMAGYGGLFWRGPRSFNDGTVLASDGRSGPDMMGQRSPWLAYVGSHDGTLAASTVVMTDEAANPRHPTPWFVRNTPFACMSAAFMFDQALVLPAGETLTLRHRMLIADGAWDAARIERALDARG